MSTLAQWRERSDWRWRAPGFRALCEHEHRVGGSFVAMELGAAASGAAFEPVWQRWLDLPNHPNVLEAVEDLQQGRRLVRYAAIDWRAQPIELHSPAAIARAASWGAKLVRVCELIVRSVPAEERGWMAAPTVVQDLEGEPRVAFVPSEGSDLALPPEVTASWPRCDEPGMVFVAGRLLRSSIGDGSPLAKLVDRAVATDPAERFATLDELMMALIKVGARRHPRELAPHTAWSCVEAALGYLALGRGAGCVPWLASAISHDDAARRRRGGRDSAAPLAPAMRDEVAALLARPAFLSWPEVRGQGAQLESAGRFADARSLYRQVLRPAGDDAELAVARCSLALGALDEALACARRVLDRAPAQPDALAVAAAATLRAHRHDEALAFADRWLAAAPDEGRAELARGHSLLGLARLDEARAAFVRASARGPQILEALAMRREVDRAAHAVRAAAGTAEARALALPPHLDALRELLASGRHAEAIEILRTPAHALDAAAQLLLASLLSYEQRDLEAIAVYAHAMTLGGEARPAAMLGQANLLLAVGRADEALALFTLVGAEQPARDEALEGRARALARLGRAEEADAVFARYVARTGERSELRVQLSQRAARPAR